MHNVQLTIGFPRYTRVKYNNSVTKGCFINYRGFQGVTRTDRHIANKLWSLTFFLSFIPRCGIF